MTPRRAGIGDEAILRELRLRALTDAPDAFGSTYERELARTVEDWRRWLSPGATFVLDDGQVARGLVACARDATAPAVVNLMAMWVHPMMRGSGAADALVAEVIAWAHAEGARMVRLQVVQGNLRAQRVYERHAFRATGRTCVRERDGVIEVEMERVVETSTGGVTA
ncbi:MAG TPA: GNAT family N-acetyltransferase [Vicinamibacterales bacterium]